MAQYPLEHAEDVIAQLRELLLQNAELQSVAAPRTTDEKPSVQSHEATSDRPDVSQTKALRSRHEVVIAQNSALLERKEALVARRRSKQQMLLDELVRLPPESPGADEEDVKGASAQVLQTVVEASLVELRSRQELAKVELKAQRSEDAVRRRQVVKEVEELQLRLNTVKKDCTDLIGQCIAFQDRRKHLLKEVNAAEAPRSPTRRAADRTLEKEIDLSGRRTYLAELVKRYDAQRQALAARGY